MIHVGVDIGGTNITVGIVNNDFEIINQKKIKTEVPKEGEKICEAIATIITEALDESNISLKEVSYIGIGCPGTVNIETGIVEFSANLFLHNWDLSNQMKNLLGIDIVIDNDANAAAYGESIAGAAKNYNSAVVITLGTGVGSGIIIGNKIYRGINYAGAEIGHMVIKHNGRKCSCSRRGCFESYASATGVIKTTKNVMKRYKADETILWELVENDISKVSGRTAFQAAKMNDKIGQMIVDKYISDLSCGLINVINIFQPDVMCIGGGLSKEDDEFLLFPLIESIERERYSKYSEKQTKIVKAILGNDAGIIGASMIKSGR